MRIRSFNRPFAHLTVAVCLAFTEVNAGGAVAHKSAGALNAKAIAAAQDGKRAIAPTIPRSPNRLNEDYVIGPSDVLNINVWKDAELTRTVTVRPDGRITLPLVGEMQVSGLTASNVQLILTKRLKDYVSNPEVTVIVQEVKSQSYIVVGKVVKPGSFELGKPTTVLEAIAIAGGFLDFAKTNKVYILRRQAGSAQLRLPFDYKKVINQKNTSQNVELKNGDTIVVP